MFSDTGGMFTDNGAELSEGVPHHKSSVLASQLKAKLAAMTAEEQIEHTAEILCSNSPWSHIPRCCKGLKTIKMEVRLVFLHFSFTASHTQYLYIIALHAHTGIEVAMFAAHMKINDYLQPCNLQTSSRT